MMKIGIGLSMALILGGCGSTRSISYHTGNSNHVYHGELSQFDVLSQFCDPAAVTTAEPVAIPQGSRIFVVQSGQMSPEGAVVAALSPHVAVVPFAGIPAMRGSTGSTWNHVTKLGGVDAAIVYWGEIETAYTSLGTAYVSWVPVVGWFIPDSQQKMRIRMKFIIVDIATGRWEFYELASAESTAQSTMLNRGVTDAGQITALKREVLTTMTQMIIARISDSPDGQP